MVVQVATHARQFQLLCDAVLAQLFGATDAGQQQQLRRVDRAAGQHDLACGLGTHAFTLALEFDGDGTPVLDHDAFDHGAGRDGEVVAIARGVQVAGRRAPALTVFLRQLVEAEAFHLRAIEVRIERKSILRGGVEQHLRQRIAVTMVGDIEVATAAMEIVGAAFVVLAALEVGQHRIPVPAGGAHRRPLVVVARMATDVTHGVDRTGTAEHLAAWPPQPAAVEVRFGFCVVVPVHAFAADQLGDAGGHVDEGMPVARAGFEQQHAGVGVGRQTIREHAARGARTDDDVVVGHKPSFAVGGPRAP